MIGSEMLVTCGERPIRITELLLAFKNMQSLSAGLTKLVDCGPGAAVTPLLEPL